ncbi:outer membrane beta-barrel protein [Gammaproteobacteria bacterium AB-CW1]|uniref:Outer membrane beta-barrel protein n=2 Tax=Natronospira TaxID=2024969 RepID=A0AAP6JEH3_9GAMM|nr:outer membrane beta-barrel protein [Gammaproteobacteria bacterium AB-CW1]
MKKQFLVVGSLLALTFSASVAAEGFDADRMYVGGGINQNSVSGLDDATGFQIFAGYNLGDVFDVEGLDLLIEGGYWTSGDFEGGTDFFGNTFTMSADGIWGTAVFDYAVNPDFSLLGRAGLDLGDDDGLMIGFGGGWNLNPEIQLRGEYVIRDNIDSLQFNVTYDF